MTPRLYQSIPKGQGPLYQSTPKGQGPLYQSTPKGQGPLYQSTPKGQGPLYFVPEFVTDTTPLLKHFTARQKGFTWISVFFVLLIT